MAFVVPGYSRGRVDRAGEALRREPSDADELALEMPVITNWRAAHAYPLNTFQATLRDKLNSLGSSSRGALVGQRLKRLPSIEQKLRRFPQMQLARMQDIAGLRAVVPSIIALRKLQSSYLNARFLHELRGQHDYLDGPKDDGYRSIHLIYRYRKKGVSPYDGLHVELQLRTRLQHSWATAVETVDMFANQAIKQGNASPEWSQFFKIASAAFALRERCNVPAEFAHLSENEVRAHLIAAEKRIGGLVRLRGFAVAANHIHRQGASNAAYHLVILNMEKRSLTIKPFPRDRLDEATIQYADAEKLAAEGAPLDPVLVAGGNVQNLRKAYPNYFLDATSFVENIAEITAIGVHSRPRSLPTKRSS